MKLTIDVECTPEEARRAMGLPDLTPLHERYLARMLESFDAAPPAEMLDQMVKGWAPMSEAGLAIWRQLATTMGGRSG